MGEEEEKEEEEEDEEEETEEKEEQEEEEKRGTGNTCSHTHTNLIQTQCSLRFSQAPQPLSKLYPRYSTLTSYSLPITLTLLRVITDWIIEGNHWPSMCIGETYKYFHIILSFIASIINILVACNGEITELPCVIRVVNHHLEI